MTGEIPLGVLVRRGHFSETCVAPDGKGGQITLRVSAHTGDGRESGRFHLGLHRRCKEPGNE